MSEDDLAGAAYALGHEREGPLVGEYSYDVLQDRWTWSRAVFQIHGFEPHDVVPTTELIRFHAHPEDRDSVAEALEGAIASPGPFTLTYRLLDARGGVRRVLLLGSQGASDQGAPGLRGQLVDLTTLQDEIINDDLSPMVDDFRAHRAVIEQAKGIVIQLFAIDADEAFDRLRACSQRLNVKVRDLAEYLVLAAATDRTPDKNANSLGLAEVLEVLLMPAGETG
jgi:hypothetical protein